MEENKYKLVSAQWCSPCKVLKSQLAEEGIDIEVIDVDENSEYVQKMDIRSVPTLVVNDSELITSNILDYLKDNI